MEFYVSGMRRSRFVEGDFCDESVGMYVKWVYFGVIIVCGIVY